MQTTVPSPRLGENEHIHNHNTFELPRQAVLMRLTPDDWPVWRQLRLAALTEAPSAFGSKLADWQGAGDLEERWRKRLSSVPLNLVATLNEVPVGMVSVTDLDEDGTVELISLWVAPSGRGFGVGDALVAAAIKWASEQNASSISLDVTEGNEQAMKLYFRHGFVDMGELDLSDPEEEPGRRLLKRLSLVQT